MKADQRRNTESIDVIKMSIAKIASTFEGFLVESRHTRKDVDEVREDIHGKGKINDRLRVLETARDVEDGKKNFVKEYAKPVGSFIAGALLVVLAYMLGT